MSIAELNEIKDYIDKNFYTPINVKSLAGRFNMGLRTLQRRFHHAFDETIRDYISRKRIESSKLLLSDTDLPVSTIAERVGYTDPSSFTRAFTQQTGHTPIGFRNDIKTG